MAEKSKELCFFALNICGRFSFGIRLTPNVPFNEHVANPILSKETGPAVVDGKGPRTVRIVVLIDEISRLFHARGLVRRQAAALAPDLAALPVVRAGRSIHETRRVAALHPHE